MLKKNFQKALVLGFLGLSVLIAAKPSTFTKKVGNDASLQRLLDGNKRFVSGFGEHPDQTQEQRMKVAKKQTPFAVVLTCADSRVAPEIVFDQGLGDLFVVRVAGNTLDSAVVGSIEYAVEHLGSHLVVIMGHERCGAVGAALKGGELPGSMSALVKPMRAAVKATEHMKGDRFHNTVVENVKDVTARLRQMSPLLAKLIQKHELTVVGSVYNLDSGKVTFF